MVTIIFEAHGTTTDNEQHLASGHNDVELSELGIRQSHEMGERYKGTRFDAIFCSDMQRSYKSAELAFGENYPIIQDARLRECDYGDLTQHPKVEVDSEKANRLDLAFPNGESYEDASDRMRNFLIDLAQDFQGKTVMIIGHRATQYGLEHWVNQVSLLDAIIAPWSWQPGWKYNWTTVPEINSKTQINS